ISLAPTLYARAARRPTTEAERCRDEAQSTRYPDLTGSRHRRRGSSTVDRGVRRAVPGRSHGPRAGGPAAVPALPRAARPRRARSADRALPAARTPAGPSLPARRGAARRPDPGRLAGPGQGDRSLRRRPRGRVLELRGADDPGGDQAPLPRPD